MIDAKELMIGNWIDEHFEGCRLHITAIDNEEGFVKLEGCDDKFDFSDLNPIPLTPEILTDKFGYLKLRYNNNHFKNPDNEIGLYILRNGVLEFRHYDLIVKVNHVHQLQNLLTALGHPVEIEF